jgi:Outer membrane protein beta-barrel domain
MSESINVWRARFLAHRSKHLNTLVSKLVHGGEQEGSMRRIVFAAAIVGSVLAVMAGTAGTARADGMDDKKIVVGGDVQFVLPLNSDFSNATGPLIGAVIRGGYRVTPALEVTARIGYLAGLSKSQSAGPLGNVSTSISDIPIWIGARYYLMNAPAGLYGAAEIGLNDMTAKVSEGGTSLSAGETREGFNLGAGYVISPDLPIDIRAQFMYLNLLGTENGEKALFGLGISAGYSVFF